MNCTRSRLWLFLFVIFSSHISPVRTYFRDCYFMKSSTRLEACVSPRNIGALGCSILLGLQSPIPTFASEQFNDKIQVVPLMMKPITGTQFYADIARGFKLLRPFGYNEFQGSGEGYLVKFASLTSVDENVIVGSVPASADKTSISDYGSVEEVGAKLLQKRGAGAMLVKASIREVPLTRPSVVSPVIDGAVGGGGRIRFYDFQFDCPLDPTLPRPRSDRDGRQVQLYSLCVHKGRLWSLTATSTDKLFPRSEGVLRAAVASFVPTL